MPKRQLVRVKEAQSHRPEWTERRVRRAVYEKRIPHYKVDGIVFVDLADLDAKVEAGRVEAV